MLVLGCKLLYEHAPDQRYALQKFSRERAVGGSFPCFVLEMSGL
jgi:hypothetical protein